MAEPGGAALPPVTFQHGGALGWQAAPTQAPAGEFTSGAVVYELRWLLAENSAAAVWRGAFGQALSETSNEALAAMSSLFARLGPREFDAVFRIEGPFDANDAAGEDEMLEDTVP